MSVSLLSVSRRDICRLAGLGGAAALLAACSGAETIVRDPGRLVRDPKPYRPADPAKFATIINAYRARNRLAPWAVDEKMNAIATTYARHMAEANEMSHDLPQWGPLRKRMTDAGYAFLVVGENLGEGYRDMDDVFEGWRQSPGHDRGMRDADATVMGIGSAYREQSTYKAFWCLVFAKPRGAAPQEPLVAVRRKAEPDSTLSIGGFKMPF